jgi:hypothetical protein
MQQTMMKLIFIFVHDVNFVKMKYFHFFVSRNLKSDFSFRFFCHLRATSVNILSSFSLYCHYMFQSNRPSSGVQVVVMKESATHCNAVLLFLCNCLGKQLVDPHNLELVRGRYIRKEEKHFSEQQTPLSPQPEHLMMAG